MNQPLSIPNETIASELAIPETAIVDTCVDISIPEMGVIEQVWKTNPIPDKEIASRAAATVRDFEFEGVRDGGEVAIGVGSRGIANLPTIVRGVVDGVEGEGYDPFVFPAMGSHRGRPRKVNVKNSLHSV